METKKILYALALPAVFTACSDDFKEIETNVSDEVNLGEVIGTDVAINASRSTDAESRIVNGEWVEGDKLGFALFTNNNVSLNYMYENEGGNLFSTKGNMYEGTHFAYYPFEYQAEQNTQKVVILNPEITTEYNDDRYNKAFYLSPKANITKENIDIDGGSYALKDVVFPVVKMVNQLGFQINTENINTDLFKVNGFKVTVSGPKLFYNKMTLYPTKLPVYDSEKDLKEELMTKSAIFGYGVTNKALCGAEGDASNSLSVAYNYNDGVMSNEMMIRLFTFPINSAIESNAVTVAKKITFTLTVDGGSFNIKYVNDAAEGSIAELNNKAIMKMAELLTEEKEEGRDVNLDELIGAQGFKIYLSSAEEDGMFTPGFNKIQSVEDWNKCVELVNNLGWSSADFTITKNVTFEDNITLPESAILNVKTKGSTSVILTTSEGNTESFVWPSNLKADKINITADCKTDLTGIVSANKLTVNEGAEVNVGDFSATEIITNNGNLIVSGEVTGKTFTNNKSILANENAVITNVTNNTNGTIEVTYGAQVKAVAGSEGKISYTVEDLPKLYGILLTGEKMSGVNTVIFDNVKDFVVDAPVTISDGAYGDASGQISESAFNNIDVIIKNSSLTTKEEQYSAKSINFVGTSSVNENITSNKITVEKEANVTIAPVVTRSSGVFVSEYGSTSLELTNSGVLTVNKNLTAGTINNNADAKMTVKAISCTTVKNNGSMELNEQSKVTNAFNNGTGSSLTIGGNLYCMRYNGKPATFVSKNDSKVEMYNTNNYIKAYTSLNGVIQEGQLSGYTKVKQAVINKVKAHEYQQGQTLEDYDLVGNINKIFPGAITADLNTSSGNANPTNVKVSLSEDRLRLIEFLSNKSFTFNE